MKLIRIGKDKIEFSIIESDIKKRTLEYSDAVIKHISYYFKGSKSFLEMFEDDSVYGFSPNDVYGGLEESIIRG